MHNTSRDEWIRNIQLSCHESALFNESNHSGITSTSTCKMAAEVQSADSSDQLIPSRREESTNEVFLPRDTLDQPCDVTLMVEGGKEFKAHRRVLSEASPFFQNLLNSDMKETQEGVVRLGTFTESVMAATLQFIYTGDVQILGEDNAQDLFVLADYLFLDKLKLLAGGVLVKTLNTSNCISTYAIAERYQCEDVLWKTRKFILANFTSIYAARREDVLNMSSREVEMWISSDEIHVSAEEEVFKMILEWTDHDRSQRKKYFVELFRHVRLVYVSRDFLLRDIVTNELVQDNKSCLTTVKDAIDLVDSQNGYSISVRPRKSLEAPVIVVNVGENVLCYSPRENGWCKLGEIPAEFIKHCKFVPCGGQLYSAESDYWDCLTHPFKHVTYNPYSNSCVQLPSLEEPVRYLRKTFVRNGDEMYALMSEPCVREHLFNMRVRDGEHICHRKHTSFLTKYHPETNSWKDVSSFDHLDLRQDFCIVANDDFIYFIGGIEWTGDQFMFLSDVDRYDLSRNKWDKVADIQSARKWAHGAAVNEKIYIAGGIFKGSRLPESRKCEVYDESTNEWQFITSFRIGPGRSFETLLTVDGEVYTSSIKVDSYCKEKISVRIECYKPEEDKWETKTEVTAKRATVGLFPPANVCSMRIFKEIFNMGKWEEAFFSGCDPGAGISQPSFMDQIREKKCFIM